MKTKLNQQQIEKLYEFLDQLEADLINDNKGADPIMDSVEDIKNLVESLKS